MASPFSFILPRSPQGAGYSNSFRVQGHVFKTENDIAEEYMEEDVDQNSPYSLTEYQVQGHDTLFGIALSHNLSPETVMYDNGLSTDQVYTGQIIKIRKKNRNGSRDASRKGSTEPNGPGLFGQHHASKGDFLAEQCKEDDTDKCLHELNMFYNTGVGDVEGTLKVDENLITFIPKSVIEKNPSLLPRKHLSMPLLGAELDKFEREDKLAKFITCIDVRDIDECNVIAVPNPDCDELYELTKEFPKDYLLQIILKHHGGISMGKYFDSLMSKLRLKNVSYACVYFKVHGRQDSQREFTNKVKHRLVLELQNAILAAKSSIKDSTEASSMTKIPYIEFLYEKFDPRDGDLLRKAVKKTVMNDRKTFQEHEQAQANNKQQGNRGFFGKKFFAAIKKMTGTLKLMDDSQTLTKDQFGELMRCVPQLYQTLDWELIYSNKAHGTSFSTMMRKTANASPLILVVKDQHGFSFGAFVSHRLKLSSEYYGSGETFLFTFRDLEDISTFHWSKKNSMFINVSEGGIMFGAGPQYGLWINNELTKGRSYQCDTFDNPVLSLESEFQIIKMEVWTISDAARITRLVKHNSIL